MKISWGLTASPSLHICVTIIINNSYTQNGCLKTKFNIPKSIQAEHEEIHEELSKISRHSGKIGAAAKAVAEVLHPHFEKEEEYAMPPLGLLTPIADGKITSEMSDVLKLTGKLRAELPKMIDEHRAIVAKLKALRDLSIDEGVSEYMRFVDKLKLHAQNEEEVLYPASILVGDYLGLVLKK